MPATPATSDRGRERINRLSRRDVLGGLAVTSLAGLAGCSGLINSMADQALGDVNIFNETEKRMHGMIEITGPGNSVAFSERFKLRAQTGEEPTDGASAAYEGVWESAGSYTVHFRLDDGLQVRGESSKSESVTIEDPDNQMLGVALGADSEPTGIAFAVSETWTGFQSE
jgi:hypothetical protein